MSKGRATVIPDDRFFMEFQRKWIEDSSKFKLCQKSRQIGYTLTTAYDSVINTASDKSTDTFVSSTNESSAKMFLSDCRKFSNILQMACEDINQDILVKDKMPASFAIRFKNDKTIYSMSSNPNSLAGRRGNIKLDEFALHENAEELLSVSSPCLTWGGTMSIISTHRGYNTTFNNLIREVIDGGNPKGISLHSYSLEDALNQGLLYKIQSKLPKDDPILDMDEAEYFQYIKKGCINLSIFNREYMLIPDQSENNFFPNDLITPCMDGQMVDGPCFIGIDFGRTKDSTVVWCLNKHNNHYYTREIKVMNNVEFSEQEITIINLIERYNPVSVGCDSKGIGMHITENLRKKFKSVVSLNSTANSKESNAYIVKKRLEDNTLHLPKDTDIISDFSNIQKIVTPNGVRFESTRNESGHGDRYSALAIAMEVAESKKPFFFMPSTT